MPTPLDGLSDLWCGHDDDSERAEFKRASVHDELNREIGPEHELSGRIVRVEAFFDPSDDVIVRLTDDTFALVHPTWSCRREPSDHPNHEPTRTRDRGRRRHRRVRAALALTGGAPVGLGPEARRP